MTVTLNLKQEVKAGLAVLAQASGMTMDEYLLSVVESAVFPAIHKALSAEERVAAFEVLVGQPSARACPVRLRREPRRNL